MSLNPSPLPLIDPSNFKIGIVASLFNPNLVNSLLARVQEVIHENGTPQELLLERVPGSNELPAAINLLLEKKSFTCVIGLGVVIKGSTSHHHLVAESAGNALQSLVIKHNTPIINGILVTDDLKSAEDRVTGSIDRGKEFAQAALHMAKFKEKWTTIS
ncbi:MAG: 6,7-dimethyl-8-ribityllumazine synthase [Opitutales bacterium]|nr:6,7-dimethyl-8-ribityllumazine synthase [Opitutales bacterium]